jgi:HAE1 family hydrophobic/amphiphilic exporter-1
MFSGLFINRPIFASVISIVITLIGAVAMVALPVARYPEIAPPTISVSAVYPGANAVTVGETVATPIEQEINGVENMAYMSSISTADGGMNLTVTFDVGSDLDMANVLVQNRLSTAMPKLPQEVTRQGVEVKKKSSEITLFLALYSDPEAETQYSDLFLSNYASLYIRDELSRVPGVGDVMIFGVGDYSMRIWLDPERMTAYSITTNDVVSAIRDQNVEVAAGQVGRPPAPEGQAFQLTVNTLGRLSTVEEFQQIIVRTGTDGKLLRVGDVAEVELGSSSYDTSAKLNGIPACAMGIYQLPGANAIQVARGVREALDRISERFPPGLKSSIVYDSTVVINACIHEVVVTLVITLVLVVLTVYMFLQNFRATLIPALTIPVSLVGTFAVMAVLGYSINQLTLFGLVLVIGIVVDDAIIVVENVTRHLDEGETDPKVAARKAMAEVTGPVIATTLVLLSVFVPTVFMGGIIGQLFRQFAVTISIATIFSSINALTLSPALCGVLLRPGKKRQFILFRWFNTGFEKVTNVYVSSVKRLLRIAVVGLLLFVGLIVLAGYGFSALPTGFVPQEDEGWAIANIRLPDGASLQRTNAVMRTASQIIEDTPGVQDVLAISGYSLIDGGVLSNGGSLIFVLENWDERKSRVLHQRAILFRVNLMMRQIEEAICMAFAPPSLPGIGMAGGFTMQIQDTGGAGLNSLQQVSEGFVFEGATQTGLAGMYTGFRANVPQLFVDIDRDQVRSVGIPLQEVFDTLGAYLGGAYVNDFTLFNRVYKVYAQALAKYRASETDIKRLELRAPDGDMLPLGTVAQVEEVLGPQLVSHHNIYPSAKITGQAAPGFTSGQAMDILESMANRTLPDTMSYAWSELSYQEQAASGKTSIIFLFSVILVYLVLAAQYESWSIPISVCLAVPTALLGAVAALMIRQIDNNAYTQIGVVLLIGLSAKTSILIVEFAKVERDRGQNIVDAAVAASRLRFRAVMMTALAFILGVIPLLIASGAGAESRKALGTTVFGGMIVATFVSVLAVPMLFRIIQGLSEKLTKKRNDPKPSER